MATLEAEEHDRLLSLRASMIAFEAEGTPTRPQLNALLVSALQAQVTLMRMSRVFPNLTSSKRTDVTVALSHGPTAALARELHRVWHVFGLTDPTLRDLLRHSVFAVGELTRRSRSKLFPALIPKLRKGVDPNVLPGLAAEGPGQVFYSSSAVSLESEYL